MNNQDFSIALEFDKTPEQVFEAINNVRGWWSKVLVGDSQEQGDEFIYRHGDMHYSKHRVTELFPNKRVKWLTLEGSINFVENKDEWNNTEVIFEISQENGKTKLNFTHVGLKPGLECFKGCSGGWTYYIGESLRNLIETGKGNPDTE